MAKKANIESPVVEEAIVETSTPKAVAKKDVKPDWEIRDRLYTLKTNKRPLIFTIPAKHTAKTALLYFCPEKGYQREIRYATNQRSVFVDEQQGIATLGRIVLRDGALTVPKENQSLQKLLSLYHPYRNEVYEEYNPVQRANNEVNWIEYELQAMNMAKALSLDEAEAILRVEFGSQVNKYSSDELKRDILVFARRKPILFLELANDDNVQLRNFGIKATEAKLLKLSADQRTFTYGDGNRKLMTVPFDEHPYSALASFFKTDEGLEVYKALQKRM
jgi:hypothetical protein